MSLIRCVWCKDGTMMDGQMTCLICDGRMEVEENPEPHDPETQRVMDEIETHCREWRELASNKRNQP